MLRNNLVNGQYYIYAPDSANVMMQLQAIDNFNYKNNFTHARLELNLPSSSNGRWTYDANQHQLKEVLPPNIDRLVQYFVVTDDLIQISQQHKQPAPYIQCFELTSMFVLPAELTAGSIIAFATPTKYDTLTFNFYDGKIPVYTYIDLSLDGCMYMRTSDTSISKVQAQTGKIATFSLTWFKPVAQTQTKLFRFTTMWDPLNNDFVSWFSTKYAPANAIDVSDYDRTKQMFNCWYADDGGDCDNDDKVSGKSSWCQQDDGSWTRRCQVITKDFNSPCPDFGDNRNPLVFQRKYSGLATRDKCAYTKMLNTNYSQDKKELCFSADPSVMTKAGKINSDVCALTKDKFAVYGWNLPGESDGNDLTSSDPSKKLYRANSAWAPWTSESLQSQAFVNYCSQHDTINDQPMFSSDARCSTILAMPNNYALQQQIQTEYCTKYPMSSDLDCPLVCGSSTGGCHSALNQYCKGENLQTNTCKQYCSLSDVNCDADILKYCSSLSGSLGADPTLCGCFQSSDFYNNYFNGLNKLVPELSSQIPNKPNCFFPQCAIETAIKPYSVKQNVDSKCPDIQSCIQVTNVDNQGTINDGNVIINNSMNCSWAQPKCAANQIVSSKQCSTFSKDSSSSGCSACQDCPVNTRPNSDQSKCEDIPSPTPAPQPSPTPQPIPQPPTPTPSPSPQPTPTPQPQPSPQPKQYRYITSDWGKCNASCFQFRNISCVDENNVLAPGMCTGDEPSVSQTCTGDDCPSSSTPSSSNDQDKKSTTIISAVGVLLGLILLLTKKAPAILSVIIIIGSILYYIAKNKPKTKI